MFQVIYIPKIEDEVVLGEYKSITDAILHMDKIKLSSMKAYKHHYIKRIT